MSHNNMRMMINIEDLYGSMESYHTHTVLILSYGGGIMQRVLHQSLK